MMMRNVFRVVAGSLCHQSPRITISRTFSEFYHPYPQTSSQDKGQYLVQAVHDGEQSTIGDILDSGVDPNYRWKENVTPVMIAAENNKMTIMKQLIKHGADVNLQDDLGETALMKASRESHKEVVEELLKYGAQKDILNYEHMTAREATLDPRVDAVLAGASAEESAEATFAAQTTAEGEPLGGM